jgi:hypothetical protein
MREVDLESLNTKLWNAAMKLTDDVAEQTWIVLMCRKAGKDASWLEHRLHLMRGRGYSGLGAAPLNLGCNVRPGSTSGLSRAQVQALLREAPTDAAVEPSHDTWRAAREDLEDGNKIFKIPVDGSQDLW